MAKFKLPDIPSCGEAAEYVGRKLSKLAQSSEDLDLAATRTIISAPTSKEKPAILHPLAPFIHQDKQDIPELNKKIRGFLDIADLEQGYIGTASYDTALAGLFKHAGCKVRSCQSAHGGIVTSCREELIRAAQSALNLDNAHVVVKTYKSRYPCLVLETISEENKALFEQQVVSAEQLKGMIMKVVENLQTGSKSGASEHEVGMAKTVPLSTEGVQMGSDASKSAAEEGTAVNAQQDGALKVGQARASRGRVATVPKKKDRATKPHLCEEEQEEEVVAQLPCCRAETLTNKGKAPKPILAALGILTEQRNATAPADTIAATATAAAAGKDIAAPETTEHLRSTAIGQPLDIVTSLSDVVNGGACLAAQNAAFEAAKAARSMVAKALEETLVDENVQVSVTVTVIKQKKASGQDTAGRMTVRQWMELNSLC